MGHGFRIPLSVPHMAGNERRYLEECLETNYVSSVGPFVERFEREFAAYVGAQHAVACSNGTAAIHLAMRLLELGPGDEVLVSSFTFAASANPILYERATPVFVDSERETWNLDPALVLAEVERRARLGLRQPKAVEVVHILGHPAQVEPLVGACERHGIWLIEDAAESLGARYRTGRFAGRHVGTLGRVGCFSFNGNKVLTTGGGGMLVTDDEALALRARHLARQARIAGPDYVHDEVGFNYRMTNLAAALGVAQLEQLPAFLRRKHELASRYDAALSGLPGVALPPRAAWADAAPWLYSILVGHEAGTDARELRQQLAARGIEARSLWCPLHTQKPYAGAPRLGGEVATGIFSAGLSLPSSVGLTRSEQDQVLSALHDLLPG